MADEETIITWLKDAHAMERSIEETLKRHADAAEDHPDIEQGLRAHAEMTRTHAEEIEACLERYGSDTSGTKETMSSIMGSLQGALPRMANDTLAKNLIADYAAEHFEVASYMLIAEAAAELGDSDTVDMCEQLIEEEQSMAGWLEDQVPHVISAIMGVEAEGGVYEDEGVGAGT